MSWKAVWEVDGAAAMAEAAFETFTDRFGYTHSDALRAIERPTLGRAESAMPSRGNSKRLLHFTGNAPIPRKGEHERVDAFEEDRRGAFHTAEYTAAASTHATTQSVAMNREGNQDPSALEAPKRSDLYDGYNLKKRISLFLPSTRRSKQAESAVARSQAHASMAAPTRHAPGRVDTAKGEVAGGANDGGARAYHVPLPSEPGKLRTGGHAHAAAGPSQKAADYQLRTRDARPVMSQKRTDEAGAARVSLADLRPTVFGTNRASTSAAARTGGDATAARSHAPDQNPTAYMASADGVVSTADSFSAPDPNATHDPAQLRAAASDLALGSRDAQHAEIDTTTSRVPVEARPVAVGETTHRKKPLPASARGALHDFLQVLSGRVLFGSVNALKRTGLEEDQTRRAFVRTADPASASSGPPVAPAHLRDDARRVDGLAKVGSHVHTRATALHAPPAALRREEQRATESSAQRALAAPWSETVRAAAVLARAKGSVRAAVAPSTAQHETAVGLKETRFARRLGGGGAQALEPLRSGSSARRFTDGAAAPERGVKPEAAALAPHAAKVAPRTNGAPPPPRKGARE